MSWDDEAILGATTGGDDAALMDSWDAEEPIMESWDAEEQPAKTEEAPKKAKSDASKKTKKDGKKKSATDQVLLEIDVLDEKTRKELMKKAELDSDLNNAAELFAGLGVAEEHPRARALRKEQEDNMMKVASLTKDTPIENHPLFDAESKKDFQDLRKALSTAIAPLYEKSTLNYTSALAIDLIRDVAKPMPIESIRQTIATLNVMMKDKERQERQARLARVKGGTATGGAGKKKAKAKTNLGGAFKKDQEFDMDTNDFNDFGDDDFM